MSTSRSGRQGADDTSGVASDTERGRTQMLEISERRQDDSTAMFVQCVGYIIANLIPFFSEVFFVFKKTRNFIIVQQIYTVLRPSQGIFNFIVFFSQKIYDSDHGVF